MRVATKWSGEMASGQWSSLEIELDEEDLKRFAYPRDWDLERVTPFLLYMLLEAEGNRLLKATLYNRYPNSFDIEEVRESNVKLDEVVKKIEESLRA